MDSELSWTEMSLRSDDLCTTARDAMSLATREVGCCHGHFYAVRLPSAARFEWSGGLPQRAKAALARAFEMFGIEAQDIPGFGVRTGLDVLADVRQANDHEATLHDEPAAAE